MTYRDSSGFKRSSLSCYHKRYCNFLTDSAFDNVLLLQRLTPCCTSQPFLRSPQYLGRAQRQLCSCAVTQNAMLPQAQHSTARRSSPKGLKSPTDKLQMARQYERSGAKGPQLFHGQSTIIHLGSRPDAGLRLPELSSAFPSMVGRTALAQKSVPEVMGIFNVCHEAPKEPLPENEKKKNGERFYLFLNLIKK